MPPAVAPSLTYAQSQMNDGSSLYNQIHSHHYNVHAPSHHNGLPSHLTPNLTPNLAPNLTPNLASGATLQQGSVSTNLPPVTGQDQLQQVQQHAPVYHVQPNAAHHTASYYATTDYMSLAHHQLHHSTAGNQSLYAYPTGTPSSLTQLSSQVQSINRNSAVDQPPATSLYSSVNSLVKSTVNGSDKSDENNNLGAVNGETGENT